MTAAERVALLRPEALRASVGNHAPRLVELPRWTDLPQDEPIPVRCALAERHVLRSVPLAVAPGELLAGRVDWTAPDPVRAPNPLPPDMFSGGQRAHTALDAGPLLRGGIAGIERDVRGRLARAEDDEARAFFRGALISLEGLRDLTDRLRALARDQASRSEDPTVRAEMAELADILERLTDGPARTFHDALQAIHLVYFAGTLTVQSLYGPGRLDRVLRPYYEADVAAGRIGRERALELLCCQFLLMNHAFNLPQPVIVGGLGPDGLDTCDELTRLCLEADRLVGLVNPSLALGVNEQTPADLLEECARTLLTGRTKPSLFNDRVIVEGLQQRGVPFEDAVDYVHSTCVEITVAGRSNILVASPYINLLKPLEWMLNEGEPFIGEDRSPTPVRPLESCTGFGEFLAEYDRLLGERIAADAAEQARIRRARMTGWAFPLVSCFTADCLERGRDVDRGGARYQWTETSNVGLANVVDSLVGIRRRVFEERSWTLAQVRDALRSDWADEGARARFLAGLPRYGNDDPEADELAGRIVQTIYAEHAKHDDGAGGPLVPGFFCWIMHRILGEDTGASADGRRAHEVLADAAGAAQGRDRRGPTAAIRSITSWDHRPGLGGIVLNLRFGEGLLRDTRGAERLAELLRAYFDLGGFEVQVNAVGTDTLRAAQKDPERHADLLVRVAGYSDYFTRLDPAMQDEVIRRTEHAL